MVSDEHLLERAAQGDGAAFAEFYGRHVAAISTFVGRRVRSSELAFDLTAETFASAVQGLPGFDSSRGSARGWLFGIAHNEVRQAWRRGQVEDRARRALGLERIVLDDDSIQRIESRIDGGALVEALAALPPHEKEAVEARVLNDQSYEDIAQALRCSESVVRKRVSRGLGRLRRAAEEMS